MKHRSKFTKIALGATLALSVASNKSDAVLFQDIAPGALVFKLANFDEGTLYNTQTLNTELGVSNNPAAGAPLLDAATALQAGNAFNIAPSGNGLEDSWGIAFITQIFYANDLVTPIWDATVDNQQLTAIFYGAQDYYLKQLGVGTGLQNSQVIASTGLMVDLYLDNTLSPGFTTFDQSLGPGARTGAASYPGVTDSNVFGSPVLTTRSTAGFLRGAGDLGGQATELETVFNGDSANAAGSGAAFLSVAPTLGGVGSLNSIYDNNSFDAPHILGNTADFSIQFTTTTDGSGPWLLSSQDPIRTEVISTSVPEPATGIAALACMMPLLSRRRKAVKLS